MSTIQRENDHGESIKKNNGQIIWELKWSLTAATEQYRTTPAKRTGPKHHISVTTLSSSDLALTKKSRQEKVTKLKL